MLRAIEWILLGGASVVAIVAGVIWHRPTRIGPWLLLAASVGSLATGDVFYALDASGTADLFYLAMFALVAVGLLQLTRSGALLVDRARLIDMLACACAGLLVIWVFVIGGSTEFGLVSPADVIGDLLLLGVAGRLTWVAGRNPAAILLTVGAAGMLAGDIAYPLRPGALTETGFIVLYLAWGAAGLHPSMRQLTQPMPARPTPWDGRWAALLGISVATPPLVLLIEALSGTVRDGVVIAVAGGITLLLTITRLADSVAQHSQALTRERGLREATAALVAAADPPAVDEAVRAAIGQLMPAHAVEQVTFAADDRQLALATPPPVPLSRTSGAKTSHPETFTAGTRRSKISRVRTLLSRARPARTLLSKASSSDTSPAEGSPSRTAPSETTTHTSEFSPTAASAPGPAPSISAVRAKTSGPVPGEAVRARPEAQARSWWFGEPGDDGQVSGTLVCPLWLEPLAVARPSGGALVLTGRRDFLTATRDALEVLAGQAALALDRISLVEAVGRRDSDLYLRAVIRNTAEVMLVIDEDQSIRYASPGLRTLIGVDELPPLANLRDLVHADDRTQVRQAFQSDGDGVVFCALLRPDDTQVLVEATYRDLREDRLVQGFVVTMRDITRGRDSEEQVRALDHTDVLPAWVNRRSAQHKFRY